MTSRGPEPNLHDAALVGIELDWNEGTATITVMANRGRHELVIEGVRDVRIPRIMPWGHSRSILEVRVGEDDMGSSLEIEMQSGDVIRIAGGRAEFGSPRRGP